VLDSGDSSRDPRAIICNQGMQSQGGFTVAAAA
jgi:hypothetical protein